MLSQNVLLSNVYNKWICFKIVCCNGNYGDAKVYTNIYFNISLAEVLQSTLLPKNDAHSFVQQDFSSLSKNFIILAAEYLKFLLAAGCLSVHKPASAQLGIHNRWNINFSTRALTDNHFVEICVDTLPGYDQQWGSGKDGGINKHISCKHNTEASNGL